MATAAPPVPQKRELRWPTFLALRAGDAALACIFLPFLPLWMPLTWLVGAYLLGTLDWWCYTRPFYTGQSPQRRQLIRRGVYWLRTAWFGSVTFFLFVPDNPLLQLWLTVCLVCYGALCILGNPRDNVRGAVGAAWGLLPHSVHLILLGGWLNIFLGVDGFVFTLVLAFFGHKQQKTLAEQVALRQRAEAAADAVAAVGMNKARFFASVSHDLRQPVHAIGLYLAPLLESALDERGRKGAQGIYQSWQALEGMLSQVLDLTRLDAGGLQAELAPVELAPLVQALVVQHSAAAERKGIRVVALVPAGRYVQADALMLKRVLSNLLDNAIKFSPEDARVVLALRPAGPQWCLQVRDAGPGIAPALHAKVFEEFVQLDNPQRDRSKGQGLGLAIAQRFVGLMQGQLRLHSVPGKGTCMHVLLPRVQAAPAPPTATLMGLTPPQVIWPQPLQLPPRLRTLLDGSGLAILLVEDDLLVADAIAHLFTQLQVPLLHATDATAAWALAPSACLAACDMRLPIQKPADCDGLSLALQLRQLGIPALLMTGESSTDIHTAAQGLHVPVLLKPVKPQQLLDALALLVPDDVVQNAPFYIAA
jgi:two-component system, sensor histidine kinase